MRTAATSLGQEPDPRACCGSAPSQCEPAPETGPRSPPVCSASDRCPNDGVFLSQLTTDDDDFRAPLAHVPSAVYGIGGGLVMAVVIFGLCLFVETSFRQAVVFGVVFGALLAVGFTVLAAWSKRWSASHGITLGQRVNKALQKGWVPEGAEPTEWLPWLAHARRFWKVLTVVGLILYPSFVVIGIVVLAGGDGDWRVVVQVVFMSAFTIFSTWQGLMQLRRIRVLTLQLNTAPRESA